MANMLSARKARLAELLLPVISSDTGSAFYGLVLDNRIANSDPSLKDLYTILVRVTSSLLAWARSSPA